jgi:putative tricarboxylic transport membrane protein
MADENLRRALMVSQGSFMPVFTRPVSLILLLVILWTVVSQFDWFRRFRTGMMNVILRRDACEGDESDNP